MIPSGESLMFSVGRDNLDSVVPQFLLVDCGIVPVPRESVELIDQHALAGFVGTVRYHLLERWPVVVSSSHRSVDVGIDDGVTFFLGKLVYDSQLPFDGLLVLPFGRVSGIDYGNLIFLFLRHSQSLPSTSQPSCTRP